MLVWSQETVMNHSIYHDADIGFLNIVSWREVSFYEACMYALKCETMEWKIM